MNLEDPWVATLLGLIPPLVVGGIFYIIMRSILRSDAKERKEYAKIEAEERAKLQKSNASKAK